MEERFPTNYTNQASKEAEETFLDIIDQLHDFDIEAIQLPSSNEEILRIVGESAPERIELIKNKLHCTESELLALPQTTLLDRLLGIDRIFSFQGHVCAVDVATGKSSTLTNKLNKFERFKSVFERLGIEHAVLFRLKRPLSDDVLQEVLLQIDEATREKRFIVDIRISAQ